MATVYMDVLFFVNLIVNLMLYLSSCVIRRKKIVVWRILCAAAAGAVCSCAFFFSTSSPGLRNAVTVLLYMLCAWLVMGYDTWRDYLKNVAATFFCAFVFAGVFYLIYQYADVGSVVVFNNNVLYIDIPVFGLLCVSGICFALISLVAKAFVRVTGVETEYEVTVSLCGHEVRMCAKLDTGNAMSDPISGCPVLLANHQKIKALLPAHFDEYMRCMDTENIEPQYQRRLRMILCKTATGEGMLPAVRPDYIRFVYNGKPVSLHNILIAVSRTDLGGCGLLLSPRVIEEAENHAGMD